MRFLLLSIAILRFLPGYSQGNFDSQIRSLIKDIPSNFQTYRGTGTELTKGIMEYRSNLVIEGTQKNVIYSFSDSSINQPASYYLAIIDSTSKTRPKKLSRAWVNKVESLQGIKVKTEKYSFDMPTLGLATGTLCKGPDFNIRIYYQKSPFTHIYFLYMAVDKGR
jgi:hypothetical protein